MPIDGKAVQCGCAILAQVFVAGTFYVDVVQPSRSPKTMVRRDATLTMFSWGLREFQQALDCFASIDAQSPCAWARAMEEG
jgi:hypothetical protein